MALGQLVNGQWQTEWKENNEKGEFQRMSTQFHNWITADGSSGFKGEPNRYHLYVSLGCPWAHRAAILWKLKGLEAVIGLSIVDPVISDRGWQFSEYKGCIPDRVNHASYLYEIYTKAMPNYTGRVTVPILWDKHNQTIVNNESHQIIRMFNIEFNVFAKNPDLDFYPLHLQPQIEETIDRFHFYGYVLNHNWGIPYYEILKLFEYYLLTNSSVKWATPKRSFSLNLGNKVAFLPLFYGIIHSSSCYSIYQ
jgi:glutathionyl-hydroquinone reductase